MLTAASGTLVAILDACLVDGFGSKAAAGWTKEFAFSTTKAAYKQGVGSNGFLLRVDDSVGVIVRVRAYESMTDLDNGTNPTPSDLLKDGGGFMHKHDDQPSNGGVRRWVLVATEKAFWFQTQMTSAESWGYSSLTFFGDYAHSGGTGEFATMLICANRADQYGQPTGTDLSLGRDDLVGTAAHFATPMYNPTLSGHYIMRSWHGIGGCKLASKRGDLSTCPRNDIYYLEYNGGWRKYYRLGAEQGVYFPNSPDGNIFMSPIYLHETNCHIGRLPGVMQHAHAQGAFGQGTIVSGSGEFAGRTFYSVVVWGGSLLLEISDTW